MDRAVRTAAAILWPATAAAGLGLLLIAEEWGSAVGWAVAIMLADQIPVATPSGGRVSPALGLAIAMPLLVEDGLAVAAAFAVALAVSHVALRLSRREAIGSFLRHVFGYGLLVIAFYATTLAMRAVGFEGRSADLVVMTVAGAVWLLADTAMRTAGAVGRLPMVRYLWLVAIQDWPVVVALFASGGLFAFAFPSMRWWAVPVAAIPYAFSNSAFSRSYGARRTYTQMIRALSRIPEVAGLSPDGHAEGTASLAVAIGQEMGLHPDEVIELEYAALLHDIGRVTLNEPIIAESDYTPSDLASWGAEIVGEAPYLKTVAAVVHDLYQPYRRPGEGKDESLAPAAKILRVAAEHDRSVRDLGLSDVEAIEVLYRGAAYDFDPDVVAGLRRVLIRRGSL